MAHYQFHKDLKNAKKTEEEFFLKLLNNEKVKWVIWGNNTSDWDGVIFNLEGRGLSVELKEDFYAERSGNICFEHSCRGSPSGIETTKSHYYAYRVHEPGGEITDWIIRTKVLKELLLIKGFYFREVMGGDKGSNTKMKLVKLDVFKKHFKKV